MSNQPKIYRCAILRAGEVNNNGNCYPEEELKKMADKSEALVFEDGTLYHEMKMIDLDPEAARILNERPWDFV